MAIAPTGQMSLPVSYLENSLAASSTFRTLVSAATPALAKAFIFWVANETDPPGAGPFSVIGWMKDYSRMKDAGGLSNKFIQSAGGLFLLLRDSIDPTHTAKEAATTFINALGGIMTDIEGVSGTSPQTGADASYLDIRNWDIEQLPSRPTLDESQEKYDYYQTIVRVEFDAP